MPKSKGIYKKFGEPLTVAQTVRLTKAQGERLKAAADAKGKTATEYARTAILERLDENKG